MTRRVVHPQPATRARVNDGERGSIPFLMLVMILSAALGAVLLSTVVSQARTARFDETRVHSLDAAQAGIDYALADIRSAVSTSNASLGDSGELPCWGNGATPAFESTADPSGTTGFSVTVTYFAQENPAQLDGNQRSEKKMQTCAPGSGPYDPNAQDQTGRTPRYALIVSSGKSSRTGAGTSAGRRLETVYTLKTDDVNKTGGQIRVYSAAGGLLCMDAGTTPVIGTAVTLQDCDQSNPPTNSQVWSYREDLSILLTSSGPTATQASAPYLCLDTSSTSFPRTAGNAIVLKSCPKAPTLASPSGWSQQWSIDDYAHFRGTKRSPGATEDPQDTNACIAASGTTAPAALQVQPCTYDVSDPKQTWVPSPKVGAGAAGASNQQLVNYARFASCFDVTGTNINAGYMILYPCKQNPKPSFVSWNQRLVPDPALGQKPTRTLLKINSPSGTRCLRSPRVAYSAAAKSYPTLVACPAASSTDAGAPGMWWKVSQRYESDGSNAAELTYADRYTVKDDTGNLCLGVGPQDDIDNFDNYKVVVGECNGQTIQKWNADPSTLEATLSNLKELPRS